MAPYIESSKARAFPTTYSSRMLITLCNANMWVHLSPFHTFHTPSSDTNPKAKFYFRATPPNRQHWFRCAHHHAPNHYINIIDKVLSDPPFQAFGKWPIFQHGKSSKCMRARARRPSQRRNSWRETEIWRSTAISHPETRDHRRRGIFLHHAFCLLVIYLHLLQNWTLLGISRMKPLQPKNVLNTRY